MTPVSSRDNKEVHGRGEKGDVALTMKAAPKAMFAPAERVARRFVEARLSASALGEYPGPMPSDLRDAYAIQEAAITLWPDKIAGWKVGRINPPDSEKYGEIRAYGTDLRARSPDGIRRRGRFFPCFPVASRRSKPNMYSRSAKTRRHRRPTGPWPRRRRSPGACSWHRDCGQPACDNQCAWSDRGDLGFRQQCRTDPGARGDGVAGARPDGAVLRDLRERRIGGTRQRRRASRRTHRGAAFHGAALRATRTTR